MVSLFINFLYPADDVRESIFFPVEILVLLFHHLEQQALKPPMTIEHQERS